MTKPALPRILLIGPQLTWGWTDSTVRALKDLGCTVDTIYYNKSTMRGGIGSLRRLCGQRFGWEMPETPHWLQEKYLLWSTGRNADTMIRAARAFRPDLILILKGESLKADLLEMMKEVTGAPVAVWWMDHPMKNAESGYHWREVPRCIPLFDACFVFDRSYEKVLRDAGAHAVQFLPCAVDPHLFTPQVLTPLDRAAYGATVSFVGTYYENRAHLLSALGGNPNVRVWGAGWERAFDGPHNGLFQELHGEAGFPSETCKIYNASLVNLNVHHTQSHLGGLNCRAFEILAAGAFELTDYVPGMESLLEPDREVAVYRSPEEAAELARYYVKAEEERRRIAVSGCQRVLVEHTYRHRMQTLLGALS